MLRRLGAPSAVATNAERCSGSSKIFIIPYSRGANKSKSVAQHSMEERTKVMRVNRFCQILGFFLYLPSQSIVQTDIFLSLSLSSPTWRFKQFPVNFIHLFVYCLCLGWLRCRRRFNYFQKSLLLGESIVYNNYCQLFGIDFSFPIKNVNNNYMICANLGSSDVRR